MYTPTHPTGVTVKKKKERKKGKNCGENFIKYGKFQSKQKKKRIYNQLINNRYIVGRETKGDTTPIHYTHIYIPFSSYSLLLLMMMIIVVGI